MQNSGQNITTQLKQVFQAHNRGNPQDRDKACKPKHLVASACTTNHSVILLLMTVTSKSNTSLKPFSPNHTLPLFWKWPSLAVCSSPMLPIPTSPASCFQPTMNIPNDPISNFVHAYCHLSKYIPVVFIWEPSKDLLSGWTLILIFLEFY